MCVCIFLQFGTFLLQFSFLSQSIVFPYGFFLFKFRIAAHPVHGTIFTSPTGTITASRAHAAGKLLRFGKSIGTPHLMRQPNSGTFPLTDQSSFEIDILSPSIFFQSLQFIKWHIMNAIDGTRFNGHLNGFFIVAPLFKDSSSTVFTVHKKGGLRNHGTIGATNARVFIHIDHLGPKRVARFLILVHPRVRFHQFQVNFFDIRRRLI